MKGTTFEYLMTYGWAILIILIVVGGLAYYGIFAPAGFLAPENQDFIPSLFSKTKCFDNQENMTYTCFDLECFMVKSPNPSGEYFCRVLNTRTYTWYTNWFES